MSVAGGLTEGGGTAVTVEKVGNLTNELAWYSGKLDNDILDVKMGD